MTRRTQLAILAAALAGGLTLACAPPPAVDPIVIVNPNPCVGDTLRISDGTKLTCTLTADQRVDVLLDIDVPPGQAPTAAQMVAANNRAIQLGAKDVMFYPGSDPYRGYFAAEDVDHSKVVA